MVSGCCQFFWESASSCISELSNVNSKVTSENPRYAPIPDHCGEGNRKREILVHVRKEEAEMTAGSARLWGETKVLAGGMEEVLWLLSLRFWAHESIKSLSPRLRELDKTPPPHPAHRGQST